MAAKLFELFGLFLTAVAAGSVDIPPTAQVSSLSPQRRIVGGVETNISQVPYQSALEWKDRQFCAAAIISSRFVLTASHCLYQFKPQDLVVRVGSTRREAGGRTFAVKKVYLNPKFNETRIDYDVAVVQLKAPIRFDANSRPIALADKEPRPGQKVVVSGWGSLHERGDAAQNLHSLRITVIDRAKCEKSYEKLEKITERMICAGSRGFDSCKGDSGGPIVDTAKSHRLVGIVSWGKGCGREGFPGVYTNLANPEIRQFVKSITGI